MTSTKPLVLRDGTIVGGLRVEFEKGVAVKIAADENGNTLSSLLGDRRRRAAGSASSRSSTGTAVGPLGTVFYNTLLDENAASHIALGGGFAFLVDPLRSCRASNESGTHVDFMIGSPEVDVDGMTADGERVPVLRSGDWQI